jgi:hypothetical protein
MLQSQAPYQAQLRSIVYVLYSVVMVWMWHYMDPRNKGRDPWRPFGARNNDELNEALGRDELYEEVVITHFYGKKEHTDYVVNFKNNTQTSEDCGTIRRIRAWWNGREDQEFDWKMHKRTRVYQFEDGSQPSADEAPPPPRHPQLDLTLRRAPSGGNGGSGNNENDDHLENDAWDDQRGYGYKNRKKRKIQKPQGSAGERWEDWPQDELERKKRDAEDEWRDEEDKKKKHTHEDAPEEPLYHREAEDGYSRGASSSPPRKRPQNLKSDEEQKAAAAARPKYTAKGGKGRGEEKRATRDELPPGHWWFKNRLYKEDYKGSWVEVDPQKL